jgi:hypothetical protein
VKGAFAVVGAPADDGMGADSGSAYVFEFDGTNWTQESKLTASDGQLGSGFGSAVAIESSILVVGASDDDRFASDGGAGYVFRLLGSSWSEEQRLEPAVTEVNDRFGTSVGVCNNTVFVGAPGKNDSKGAVLVFRDDGTAWIREPRLVASDRLQGDFFGSSVSVSGDVALVGAPGDDRTPGLSVGSAYLFRFDGTSWVQEQKLTASDGMAFDMFGSSVAVDGNVAVVGVPRDDDQGVSSGSAYVYRYDGSSWVQEQKIVPGNVASHSEFGTTVSVVQDRLQKNESPPGFAREAAKV